MKKFIKAALVAALVTGTPAFAADEEINVVLFGMPYTNGLQKLAGDFEAETGIKANIDVIGQDVFENRITLSFTGGSGDIDVVHTPVIQVQRWVAADWLKPMTAEVDAMPGKGDILAGPLDAYVFIFPMVMRAYGGNFFADYTAGDLTPAINSPENLEALNVYIKLLNDYAPQGAGNFNFAEVNEAAKNGQIAFAVEGTGIVSQIVDPSKSKFADQTALALPPGGPNGRSPALGVHGLGIPANAANPEAAAKFIEWAVSKETVTKVSLSEPFPDFTTGTVADDPEVVAKYAAVHPDFLKLRVEALDLAIGHYRPLVPEWPALGQAIGENINAAVNGLMSPEEALEAAEQEMNDILGN